MSTVVGLIGLGRMGLPITSSLVRAGFSVIGGDRRAEREAPARATGALWEASPAALAAACDVLVTVLPGSVELAEAMAVTIPQLRPGATWIDMTSSSPVVGEKLRRQVRGRGAEVLDAPMGGGIPAAESGALQLFVGGPRDLVDRHRRLLEAVGSVSHMGANGTGYTTKLLANLLWFGQAVATGEALLVARRSGIDLTILHEALKRSSADSAFIRRDLDSLLDGDYLRSFQLDRCQAELDAVTALASELDVPFEVSKSVARTYGRALERYGPVGGELLAVALLEELAGTRLRREE